MSTPIENNTEELRNILQQATELPNAGNTPLEAVLYVEQTLTDDQKAQARTNIGVGAGCDVEPAEDDIPKVFFGGALPQTKDDTVMSFRYISKTMDISGYCKTKAQGNSSMAFPKKNQTVKLYKDRACTEKLKVDFKGWGKQNKFCFKANWIDLTHARNVVSARLWGDVVKSRANYETIPELLRTAPNQGAVDGFPVKVYAGGVYQGRYTINIPKDAWMANMDDELNTHCILCSENYESGCFRAAAVIDESDWTDEVHDTVPDSIKTRWNEVINFVMTSTNDEFVANIGNYFDLTSLIDYYLFGTLICHVDGFGKNQFFITYDGQKWYASVYDLDSTFGTYFSTIHPVNFARDQFEDYKKNNGNLLYVRLESLFIPEIQARWDELRKGALSLDNIINRFERFTDIAPPYLVEEDYAETTGKGKFTAIPLQGQSNIQQIRSFIYGRYEYFMHYIKALGTDGGLLYYLPDETTFNGTTDYIDTGLALMSEARSFTIFADYTEAESVAKGSQVFSCVQDAGGYGGLYLSKYRYSESNGYFIGGYPGNAEGYLFISPFNSFDENGRTKIAIVFEEGVPARMGYLNNIGTVDAKELNASAAALYPFIHSRKLLIGCREYGSQYEIKGDFWAGTIHAFEVCDYAMTAAEVERKLRGL